MESSREIEERAGTWLAKRESGNWSAEDELRFTQWLDTSIANRVAFLRQEAAWEQALRLQALKGSAKPGTVPSPESWRLTPFVSDGVTRLHAHDPEEGSVQRDASEEFSRGMVRAARRRWLRGALAAGVVLVAAAALTWHLSSLGPRYRTPVGGFASVPMKDGSKVTLNTDSEIRVTVTDTERRVELQQGEAFFDVAKDPTRPFVVHAGDKRVIAVGTQFSVRRNGNDLRVLVTEGKVRLEDDSLLESSQASALRASDSKRDPGVVESASTVLGNSNAMLLAAGSIARAGASGLVVQEKPLPEVEDYLSWRAGYLTFRDIPLAEVIGEFNRYNEHKIVIRDPAVAAIRFSGKIRPTSFEAFVRLLEDAFPVRAQRTDGRIVLTDAH